jgi:hypothetical protein
LKDISNSRIIFKELKLPTEESVWELRDCRAFGVMYLCWDISHAPAEGAFNAPGDVPGAIKRSRNAILISIALTMVITAIVRIFQTLLPILLVALVVISW